MKFSYNNAAIPAVTSSTELAMAIVALTADTALRLSLYFGNSPEFWMNLQAHYDLKMA
jgi:addiction module HigA family antidote